MILRRIVLLALLGGAAAGQWGPALALEGITARLGGAVQFDTVMEAEGSLPPGARISTGGSFRRIRLSLGGRIGENWSYAFMPRLETSSLNHLSIGNAFVQYDGLGPLHLKIGAYAAPTNFDAATSSNDLLFLERAQPGDLARSIGGTPGRAAASLFSYGDSYFAALSYTGGMLNDALDRQQAVVGRAVWRPWFDGGDSFAIGADITHLFSPPRTGAVRLQARPELNIQVVNLRLIDTGALDADSVTTAGLEAAGNLGSLYAQGGLFHYAVARAAPALSDPAFGGWYLQGSWILTGEARPWNRATGGHGAPSPAAPLGEGGFGAVEVALRYSGLDLDHRAGWPTPLAQPADAINGGRQHILTLGLNWYPVEALRLMLNYQHVTVDRRGGLDAGLDLLSLRTQVSF